MFLPSTEDSRKFPIGNNASASECQREKLPSARRIFLKQVRKHLGEKFLYNNNVYPVVHPIFDKQ